MAKERLKRIIIEKENPLTEGKPNAHTIANKLASFMPRIFSEDENLQKQVIDIFGYEGIFGLRRDAASLALSLRKELGELEWTRYFNHFKSNEYFMEFSKKK